MKQKLLLIILPMLFFTATLEAQDKVWDFGNNSGGFWPINGGTDTNIVIDNFGLFPGSGVTNFGEVQLSSKTWGDGYSGDNRLKFNGGSSPSGNMPTKRYFYFAVDGACQVDIWFRSGGSGTRTLYVSDGTTVYGSLSDTTGGDPIFLSANYTGGVGVLYIYCDSACNLYKIEVTGTLGTTLGNNKVGSQISTNIRAVGNRIYVSNVKTNTEVNIYSITGALVKSFKTNSDTDFSFRSGLWIATLKTVDGQKSVKLLTH
jgi:hypothetical protein